MKTKYNKEEVENFFNEYNSILAIYILLSKKFASTEADLNDLYKKADKLYSETMTKLNDGTLPEQYRLVHKYGNLSYMMDEIRDILWDIRDFKKFAK